MKFRQFLFNIDRINIHGFILRKRCTSHQVFSITQIQNIAGQFHKIHIPLGVEKLIQKKF